MKLNYTFSNLCGVVYDGGNAIFSPDGKSLISPVGSRVTVFDLAKETSFTLPFQMQNPVKFLALNPLGNLLFVVDETGHALLVSLLSHATLSFLKFSEPVTSTPKFSSDGLVLAVAVGRALEIWRVPDFTSKDRQFAPWQLVKRIAQHQGSIVNLNWSDDDILVGHVKRGYMGRWITTASEDMTCRVFKIEYRQQVSIKTVYINNLKAQRKSQESKNFDESHPVIDVEEEEEDSDLDIDLDENSNPKKFAKSTKPIPHRPLVISVHRHQPVLSVFHHVQDDSRTFLLTLSKEGSLFVWDFNGENGRLAHERAQKFKVAIEDKETEDENETGTGTKEISHNSVTNISSTSRPERWARLRSVSFKNGKLLVGFTDGIFGLFRVDPELERLDRLYALSLFNPDTVGDALNPGIGIDTCDLDLNGNWLAFGSAKTGQLLVWEWSTESYILRLSGVSSRTSSLGLTCSAYSPDGQLLATGGGDGKIRIWRGEGGGGSMSSSECVATFTEHVGPITSLVFAKQGHILISASQDGSVRAFDVLRFRAFKLLRPPQAVQFASLAVDCAGEIVAAGTLDSHEIYLWSLQTGQLVDVFSGHSGPITSLAFEPTRGRLLASGSWDKSVRIWDIYAAPDSKSYGDALTHEADVLSLSFRPDGVELTVATLAGHLVTWSVEGGMILSTIDGRLDIGTKALTGAAFHTICHSADGSSILAAGSFTAVALYHLPTRTLLKQYPIMLPNKTTTATAATTTTGKGLLAPKIDSLAPVARSILFSPTGRSWSVLTPEGLLIYSRDQSLLFDPFDLTPDLSAESVRLALEDGKHLQALVMSLRLNIFSVQKGVFEALPSQVFDLIIPQLPPKYLEPLLQMFSNLVNPIQAFPNESFPLQKLFTALSAIFKFHTISIKSQRSFLLPTIRIIQKAVLGHYKDLSTLVRDNSFEIDRIILEITTLNQ